MLQRHDRDLRMAAAQEVRRVRLRLCAHRPQGAGRAMGRRGVVRRVLRLSGEPRSLALHRRHARGEAADAGDVRVRDANGRTWTGPAMMILCDDARGYFAFSYG